jgi:WD repeat-containing protein 42A
VILSCGEDGVVYEIDLRVDSPTKVLLVKDGDKKIPLYSINNCMAMNPFQFVTSGRNPNVHVYDRRFLTTAADSPAPLEKLCPPHLKSTRHTVTCAVYDSIGRSVLATYNDDDIYLFDSRNGHLEHTYKGHRNSATIKGVSWFTDDFIISGSDDGYVYGWDRESEHIVMSLYADEGGVVSYILSATKFHLNTIHYLSSSG